MKTIRHLLRIGIFLLLFFVLFCYTTRVFKARDQEELSSYYYHYDHNTFDVIFAGSSMSKNAIQPVQLWENNGIAAYNLSCGNQSLACSYYILQDALSRDNPSLIVLDMTYAEEPGPVRSNTFIHYLTDQMPFMDRYRLEMIQDLLPEESRLEYYFPFYSYHSRWKELGASDFETGTYEKYTLGSVTSARTMSLSVPLFQREDSDRTLGDVSKLYIEKIITLCRDADVPLLMYCCPVAADNGGDVSEGDYNNRRAVMKDVARIADDNGITFLNFLEDDSALGLDPYNNYKDGVHLNMWGARKLTSYLGSYIREHYDIPDRRSDPDFTFMDKIVPAYNYVLMDQAFATVSRADTVFQILKDYSVQNDLVYLLCGQDYDGSSDNTSDVIRNGLTSLGFSPDNSYTGLTNIYAIIDNGNVISSGQQEIAADIDISWEKNGTRFQICTNAMSDSSDAWNTIRINEANVAPETSGLCIAVYDTERKKFLDCLTISYDGSTITHFQKVGN